MPRLPGSDAVTHVRAVVPCGTPVCDARTTSRGWRRPPKTLIVLLWLILSSFSFAQQDAPQPPNGEPPQAATPPTPDESQDPFTSLLDEELPQRWKWFSSAPDVPLAAVWRIDRETGNNEPVLVCKGQPKGFLFTQETWTNYELQLEWRYPQDADGNSGVLVYVQDESRVWPTSIQVQLHQPKAGAIFPGGDAQSDNTTESTQPNLARPTGQWNECRIVSQGGRLSVEINGRKAGEITGATPSSGRIALQSEGSEVQFRRLKIRRLPDDVSTESPSGTAEASAAKSDTGG